MIIEKYSDVEKIKNNMVVDLTKLDINLAKRILDFLAGLTYKNGSLKKIERGKYLVTMK